MYQSNNDQLLICLFTQGFSLMGGWGWSFLLVVLSQAQGKASMAQLDTFSLPSFSLSYSSRSCFGTAVEIVSSLLYVSLPLTLFC